MLKAKAVNYFDEITLSKMFDLILNAPLEFVCKGGYRSKCFISLIYYTHSELTNLHLLDSYLIVKPCNYPQKYLHTYPLGKLVCETKWFVVQHCEVLVASTMIFSCNHPIQKTTRKTITLFSKFLLVFRRLEEG